jgi:hypothetical protein
MICDIYGMSAGLVGLVAYCLGPCRSHKHSAEHVNQLHFTVSNGSFQFWLSREHDRLCWIILPLTAIQVVPPVVNP